MSLEDNFVPRKVNLLALTHSNVMHLVDDGQTSYGDRLASRQARKTLDQALASVTVVNGKRFPTFRVASDSPGLNVTQPHPYAIELAGYLPTEEWMQLREKLIEKAEARKAALRDRFARRATADALDALAPLLRATSAKNKRAKAAAEEEPDA